MKRKLYVETSIIHSLAAPASADLHISVEQSLTHKFFEEERHKYELFVSDYVYEECQLGDEAVVRERLRWLEGIEVLKTMPNVAPLADAYMRLLLISEKHKTAAFHLALCCLHKVDILLSWDSKHLGVHNMVLTLKYNERHGLHTPIMETPHALVDVYDPIIAEVHRNREELLADFGGDSKKLSAHLKSLRLEIEAAGLHYETEEKRQARIAWGKQQEEELARRIENVGPPGFVE
jgi:predicted nucleic acid-binding protein